MADRMNFQVLEPPARLLPVGPFKLSSHHEHQTLNLKPASNDVPLQRPRRKKKSKVPTEMNRAFPECSAANLPGENGARRITPSRASPRGPRLAAFLPLAVKKDSSDSNNILGEAELVQMIPPPLEALGSPLDFNLPQGGFSNTDSVAQQWRCQSVKSIKKSSKVALDPSKFPPVQMSGKELRVSRESAAAAKNEEKGNIVESFGGRVFDTTSFVASNVVGDNYRGNAADVTKGTSDGMRHELDEKGAAVRKLGE